LGAALASNGDKPVSAAAELIMADFKNCLRCIKK